MDGVVKHTEPALSDSKKGALKTPSVVGKSKSRSVSAQKDRVWKDVRLGNMTVQPIHMQSTIPRTFGTPLVLCCINCSSSLRFCQSSANITLPWPESKELHPPPPWQEAPPACCSETWIQTNIDITNTGITKLAI